MIDIRRHRPSGVRSLETGSLDVAGRPLRESIGADVLEAELSAGAAEREVATRLAEGLAKALDVLCAADGPAAGASRLYLGGGLSMLAGLDAALARLGVRQDVRLATDAVFVGCRGGAALLGRRAGVVLDLGQRQAKVTLRSGSSPDHGSGSGPSSSSSTEVRCLIPRRPAEPAASFAARTLVHALETPEDMDVAAAALVLALPCEVEDDLRTGPSGHQGLAGENAIHELVARALDEIRSAGFGDRVTERFEVLVLNDAELAAESARQELGDHETTLVVTLGSGPGAAVLDRPA